MSLAETTQQLAVTPNEGGFGAEVTGLELSRPLPAKTLAAVKVAFLAHGVLWFPNQPLTHDELEAFTLQIGPFGWDPYVAPLDDRPHILEVRREPDEKTHIFGGGWHSDWSFQETPPSATILHAKLVPPGGATPSSPTAWPPTRRSATASARCWRRFRQSTRPRGPTARQASSPTRARAAA